MFTGKIFVVVAVLALIMVGIITYLFLLDRKIGRLEKEFENRLPDVEK
jgi:hypothetical protein